MKPRFIRLRFASILLFALFVSCANIPAFRKDLKRNVVHAEEIGGFFPVWKPLQAGIDVLAGRTRHPKLKFYAVRIDLTDRDRGIIVTPVLPDGVPPLGTGKIYSIYVSSFAEANGCVAALNAGPFSPVNAREGEERAVYGLFIADGTLIAPPDGYDALVFYKNGKAAIVRQSALTEAVVGTIRNAVGGFYTVLENGEVGEAVFRRSGRHPRSAAGLGAESRFLYLLAIDGRWFDTVGATEAETGLLLRALGAEHGINLDGGGSTALAVRIEGRINILNRPIHKQIPGKERAVATCLGVR
ncbi:MAG: phosphodiester glycosidase family protein [Spirochaetaceae bacterium]|jgi:hypothetical protein|nr:phosphodiester glycosidase family protein [Spirochaetaceae bacterium]